MFMLKSILHARESASHPQSTSDGNDGVTALPAKRFAIFDTTQSTGATAIGSKGSACHVTDSATQLLRCFGKRGKGKGQLCRAGGVAVTSEGDVVVVDTDNCRLHVFNSMGQHLATIAEKGQGHRQLNQPMDVCIVRHAGEECFLVSDSVNACVKVFTRRGACVDVFGDGGGLFEYPYGVCASRDGRVVVTDICRHDVVVLSASGEKLSQFGQYGDGPRDLDHPYFVATDRDGNVVVSDSGNMAVKIFTPGGALLYHFTADAFHVYGDDFVMPHGLASDVDGNILVAANSTVYVMANDGRFWEALLPCRGLTAPRGLGFSPLGHLVVAQDGADVDSAVYVFRYPVENFRSLRAVPRPRPLTEAENASRTGQRRAEARAGAARAQSGESPKAKLPRSSSVRTRLDGGERGPAGAKRLTKAKSQEGRAAGKAKARLDAFYDQPYFLGPKPGRATYGELDGPPASYARPTPAEFDIDNELEIDIDVVHRLREKRCLGARPDERMSPAHIFGFT